MGIYLQIQILNFKSTSHYNDHLINLDSHLDLDDTFSCIITQ